MTLKQYLKITGMTHKAYAEVLGPQVTRQMVGRWVKQGAEVNASGWVCPKYVKRNKGESNER